MQRIMKHLSLENCVGYLFLFTVLCGVQAGAYQTILNRTKEWEGSCTKVRFDKTDVEIKLILKCGDRVAYTTDHPVIVAMANQDQPMNCQVFHSDAAKCTVPKDSDTKNR